MAVGELMGVVVDPTDPAELRLKVMCSGCTSYGEDLGPVAIMDELILVAEEHVRVAHRDDGRLVVPDALRHTDVYLTVDPTLERFPRVKITAECHKLAVAYPATPTTEVTVNRLLATTAEHLARVKHDPAPDAEEVASGSRIPRADVIGPLGG
jgi:hypothetical protein